MPSIDDQSRQLLVIVDGDFNFFVQIGLIVSVSLERWTTKLTVLRTKGRNLKGLTITHDGW